MSKKFGVSFGLNVALVCCLVALLLRRSQTVSPISDNSSPKPLVTAQAAAVKRADAGTNTFNWREIESEDYRTYMANLRRIGCPEQTIRDIIKADVGELYASRRQKLETDSRPENLDAQSRSLKEEEARVLATLLGNSPAPSEQLSLSQIPPRSGRNHAREQTASMPLVFRDVDVSQLKLNGDQLKAIDDLRERFLNEIGGLEQDASDPAYRERWLKSQPRIDEDLRGMIGVTAFQNYQIEAVDLAEKHDIK